MKAKATVSEVGHTQCDNDLGLKTNLKIQLLFTSFMTALDSHLQFLFPVLRDHFYIMCCVWECPAYQSQQWGNGHPYEHASRKEERTKGSVEYESREEANLEGEGNNNNNKRISILYAD